MGLLLFCASGQYAACYTSSTTLVQYRTKAAKGPKCGDCGALIPGVAHYRPEAYARISRRQKSVSRAYGGSRCGGCVKQRIVRAFLIEEQKIVKRVIRESAKTPPKAAPKAKKSKKGGK